MKKKVLFVVGSELANAGVPNVIMQIVRRLHDDFTFDVVVANSTAGYYDEEFKSYGGNIFVVPQVHSSGKLGFLKKARQIFDTVFSVLKASKYDVVHCNAGIENGLALKAAYKCGVPIRISHGHGTYINKGKNFIARAYKDVCMRMGIKYSTHRLACSSISGQTLFLGRDFENVLNPIDLEYYSKISKQPHDEIRLVQIGYYNWLKNQLFSLKVLDHILSKNSKATLEFVGYDTKTGYMEKVQQYINDNELSDFVRMLPSNYDKSELFSTADFLLLPSKSEGLPLVALEAQASNVFCLASDRVSYDVDMGLFTTMSISTDEDACKWGEWILENVNHSATLNNEKIKNVDINVYVSKITRIYGGM